MKILNHLSILRSKKSLKMIENDVDLSLVVKILQSKKKISIDTEFTWRSTYFPILSLLQISTNELIYIIDPSSISNLEALNDIFLDKDIKKVFHSARSDISVLNINLNSKFENIFDTQVAHSIIYNSQNQISYKDLVSKYFFVNLPKEQTNSNWNRRPLSKNQISYASNDVKYLHKISDIQERKLIKYRLMNEFNKLCNDEIAIGQTKIIDARLLRYEKKNKGLSSLEKDLFIWRESEAEKLNIPPNYIFKDKYFRKLKKIILENSYRDCDWIFKEEAYKQSFFDRFR